MSHTMIPEPETGKGSLEGMSISTVSLGISVFKESQDAEMAVYTPIAIDSYKISVCTQIEAMGKIRVESRCVGVCVMHIYSVTYWYISHWTLEEHHRMSQIHEFQAVVEVFQILLHTL